MLSVSYSAALVTGLILVGLVACSSPGRNYTDSVLQETLEIEILPNTSKMFVYRLRVPDDKQLASVKIERGGFQANNESRNGIAVAGSTPKRVLENAKHVTKEMGYCREGFLEIDSSISQFNSWIKGECKEGATEEDLKKFGTKKIIPVVLKK
jgi:hypothetical protein